MIVSKVSTESLIRFEMWKFFKAVGRKRLNFGSMRLQKEKLGLQRTAFEKL